MKFLKKAALLCAALLLCIGLGVATVACEKETVSEVPSSSEETSSSPEDSSDDSSESEEEDPAPTDYVYRVAVKNEGGYGFRNVDVSLKNGDEVVATSTTYSSGFAYFENTDEKTIPTDEYTVSVDNIPAGYSIISGDYKTVDLAGTDVTVLIKPEGLLSGAPATGEYYQLGEIIHDFELHTSDGEL